MLRFNVCIYLHTSWELSAVANMRSAEWSRISTITRRAVRLLEIEGNVRGSELRYRTGEYITLRGILRFCRE
jgi:hypothetical protein